MYKCPKGCTDNRFEKDVQLIRTEFIDETGTVLFSGGELYNDTGTPKCSNCGARAEWIDTRQLEMFEVQPTLA